MDSPTELLLMQLSQSPLDKRPSYDPIQGANVTPTTFYNIGDLEIQDNLGRVWYVAHLELWNCYNPSQFQALC